MAKNHRTDGFLPLEGGMNTVTAAGSLSTSSTPTLPETSATSTNVPASTTIATQTPEESLRPDLAMENNPVTTAGHPPEDRPDNPIDSAELPRGEAESSTVHASISLLPASEAEAISDHSTHVTSVTAAVTSAMTTQDPTAADILPDYEEATGIVAEAQTQPENSTTGWLMPAASSRPSMRITFDEYLSLSEITFEWGDSYDDKDWQRLSAILAPTLMVDYTDVNGHKWDEMPAADFVGIMSHIGFVGDPLVHTQHHIGASKWQKLSDEEAVGFHQLRAAHQRYTSMDLKTVENKGHGHAMVKHYYKKVDGQWKLSGLRPTVRWNEFEFDKIFRGF